jgi:hypothetical protein
VSAWGVRLAAWLFVSGGALVLGLAVRRPIRASIPPTRVASEASSALASSYPAESLATAVVGRDLFRAARSKAEVAYDPVRGNTPPPDAPPKPVLTLVGIVAGPNPTAVIGGFPGVEGERVVREGDVVAGLRVRRIGPGAVRVEGMDTVWVLKVREPWKP